MKRFYFTLTGTSHYYGMEFIKKGMKLKLVKEPDNEYDKEAIKVEMKGLGRIGYVANSARTVLGDCCSAGRLYDHMGKKAKAKVIIKTERGVICELKQDEPEIL